MQAIVGVATFMIVVAAGILFTGNAVLPSTMVMHAAVSK